MSIVTDLITAIVAKIEVIKTLVSNAGNITQIIAERDEALAGLQNIDAKLAEVITPTVITPTE